MIGKRSVSDSDDVRSTQVDLSISSSLRSPAIAFTLNLFGLCRLGGGAKEVLAVRAEAVELCVECEVEKGSVELETGV